MTDRQIIHSVPADHYAWLRSLAEADGTGVGEVVRRIVAWAYESAQEPDIPAGPTPEQVEAQQREARRLAAIAQKRAELEALERGDASEVQPSPPPPYFDPRPPADTAHRPSVLDMDLSHEPRAEEVEVPLDPDDGPRLFAGQRPSTALAVRPAASVRSSAISYEGTIPSRGAQPVPSLLDIPIPPSGQRPGTATRPAPPNPQLALGLRTGDANGNVVRANFPHLGFSRGGV